MYQMKFLSANYESLHGTFSEENAPNFRVSVSFQHEKLYMGILPWRAFQAIENQKKSDNSYLHHDNGVNFRTNETCNE